MAKAKYTRDDIIYIIDKVIREEMALKNAYIEKNGYHHRDAIDRFDTRIAAFSQLYSVFK